MNEIHSAYVIVKRRYDNAVDDYFVVIEKVGILDKNKKLIDNKDITDRFIGVKAYDTDYTLQVHVAEALELDDSNVEIQY